MNVVGCLNVEAVGGAMVAVVGQMCSRVSPGRGGGEGAWLLSDKLIQATTVVDPTWVAQWVEYVSGV
jgi:hypothetical protein